MASLKRRNVLFVAVSLKRYDVWESHSSLGLVINAKSASEYCQHRDLPFSRQTLAPTSIGRVRMTLTLLFGEE